MALVDLSGLDLSVIDGEQRMDVLQRKLIGNSMMMMMSGGNDVGDKRSVSWAEYKKRNNLLTLK